jgi:hypothetical protein
MDPSACTDEYIVTQVKDATVAWEQATFPYRKEKTTHKITAETYRNMQMLKLLFKDMELRNGKDFVFYGYPSEHGITVKFKTDGTALMAFLKWLGSDWYNNKT